jgi:hypothetical protein
MNADPYPTYEAAARDYLLKLHVLMQSFQETEASMARGALELPAVILVRQAEEIADISTDMIRLAHKHLASFEPIIREGIRGHFIDQAAVELLLSIGLLQIVSEETGPQSTAAVRATYNAVLREAISAVDRSSSAPAAQGLPIGESYRSAEFATIEEAVSALKPAIAGAAGSILRQVQELGRDIAFELAMGIQCAETIQSALQPRDAIAELSQPGYATVAAGILLNVHEKISALLDSGAEDSVLHAIVMWLQEIRQTGSIELFDEKAAGFLGIAELKKAAEAGMDLGPRSVESIAKAMDLLKSYSDKFMVLAGRMRKMEDSMRLCKTIQISQIPSILATLQISLLAALAYAGREYMREIGQTISPLLKVAARDL